MIAGGAVTLPMILDRGAVGDRVHQLPQDGYAGGGAKRRGGSEEGGGGGEVVMRKHTVLLNLELGFWSDRGSRGGRESSAPTTPQLPSKCAPLLCAASRYATNWVLY